jgi:hypothetical protein
MYQAIFDKSIAEGKGVLLWLNGQTVSGIVVKVHEDFLELRSREYSRIVVRLSSINAAAIA